MTKRIVLLLLLLLVVVAAGGYAYDRYRTDLRYNRGMVESGDVTTPSGTAPVLTNSRSETTESYSNWDDPAQDGQLQPTQTPQPLRAGLAAVGQQSQAHGARPESAATRRNTSVATDTQPRKAPDNVMVAGTGRFQVYRQGDLTWRVNTDTGNTCVLFATLEQWRKPVVYRNGCPAN